MTQEPGKMISTTTAMLVKPMDGDVGDDDVVGVVVTVDGDVWR